MHRVWFKHFFCSSLLTVPVWIGSLEWSSGYFYSAALRNSVQISKFSALNHIPGWNCQLNFVFLTQILIFELNIGAICHLLRIKQSKNSHTHCQQNKKMKDCEHTQAIWYEHIKIVMCFFVKNSQRTKCAIHWTTTTSLTIHTLAHTLNVMVKVTWKRTCFCFNAIVLLPESVFFRLSVCSLFLSHTHTHRLAV